ncbi:MAG: AAA family ATPase, partial [Synechococcus sp. cluster2_bin.235]|nr:AAA family ATPase [Synechococcus sp. cluster2_bin.235]
MSRPASIFVCQSCGAQTRQFFGRCSSCGSWNSLVEQTAPKPDGRRRRAPAESAAAPVARRSTAMADLGDRPIQRLESGYPELDRVLGGGVVPGSLVLVGGDPGIGKSTLLLQSASVMANRLSVLYVSAEESAQQVKLRWLRLGGESEGLQLLAETDLELVLEELEALRPDVAIIDSIQALHDANLSSAPGSVAQVRECAASLQRLAKRQNTALLLVGHVT